MPPSKAPSTHFNRASHIRRNRLFNRLRSRPNSRLAQTSSRILLTLLLALLTLTPRVTLHASDAPTPESPIDRAVVYSPHPHFRWKREADAKIDEEHRIQIARDETFNEVICDDRVEVVSRFVPVNSLPPSNYWWRVRRGRGEWSQRANFEVRAPETLFTIRANTDADELTRVLSQAAMHSPARVNFEPGEYRIPIHERTGLAILENARDLVIDGHGAKLVLVGESCLLSLRNCHRVTIQNFEAMSSQPGHTLVRVLEVDHAHARLVVKPEPGYDPDVVRFFVGEGNGGSFLNRVDPAFHGRHLSRGFISARSATASVAPDASDRFHISPVKATTLEHHEPGELAVVTLYRAPFVRMDATEQCTLSRITLVDHPGGPCLGNDNSAQSLLNVKVLRRSSADFQGGHSGVNNGRIGAWVEGCEYECLADDGGPAHQALRMKVDHADGPDTLILSDSWTNSEIRPADRIVLVDPRTGRFATATVRSASDGRKTMRLRLDAELAGIATSLGRAPTESWKGVLLYRYEPSNEDFVYRHNRHVGGRGHGGKFNGTRGWVADNHFENITGNPIHVGFTYTEAISGVGARDVLVSGNAIISSGWTPITCLSTSGLGGNILIRGNRIADPREAAIAIKGCNGVTITSNEFSSKLAPTKGVWITSEDTTNLRASENKHPSEVPLTKQDRPSN